jgi:hypothetical protein
MLCVSRYGSGWWPGTGKCGGDNFGRSGGRADHFQTAAIRLLVNALSQRGFLCLILPDSPRVTHGQVSRNPGVAGFHGKKKNRS